MELTLMDLKMMVDEMVDEVGESKAYDIKVRIASQPRWPFEYSVAAELVPSNTDDVVYIAEDQQLGYLPYDAKESLGW